MLWPRSQPRADSTKKAVMKKYLVPLLCSTVGSLIGGYSSSISSGADFNFVPSLFFGLIFGFGFILWKRNQNS
jgi:hypothetical protein